MKHQSLRLSGRGSLRLLATAMFALGGFLPAPAQRPESPRPQRIGHPIEQPTRNANEGNPSRTIRTRWPKDIERSLGSIAGSLAGTSAYSNSRDGKTPASVVSQTRRPQSSSASSRVVATPSSMFGTDPLPQTTGPEVVIPDAIPHGPMSGQLDSYRARAFELQESEALLIDPPKRIVIQPWWQDTVPQPLGLSKETLPVGVGQLTQIALVSSPYVQSLLTEPKIRRNDLVIADAEFDTAAFVEAKFADTNEPIGDTLTTGFLNGRFRDETYTSAAGLRRRARTGATWEVAQRSGFQDNNSTFLIPNPQGTSRLEINFTQPLLKDGGRAVNNVQVLLARIDIQLANSEVRAGLQKHLTDVTQSYWDLYQARAEWLQRKKLLAGAARLRDVLDARGQVDSLQRQIFRAEAAVASRRSDLVRAEARIRDAQAELRLLTGDPRLFQVSLWELTPQDRPLSEPVEVSVREATITALDNRPDIAQSIRKVQAASAKVGAAKNQVLPRLDLILSTYVAGLDDQRDMFGAWERQFTEGRPSYAAGLLFEIPIGNRASEARLHRNRWELTRSVYEFQQTAEIAFTDVEVAVRETHTAFNEMLAKKASIDAAEREVAYLQQRWEQLPDPNESAVLLIENLLDAQERLADEEQSLVRAQVAYAMSWVQLRKQMGVLLRFDEPLQASPLQNQMIESQPEIREAQRPAYLMQGAAR